MCGSNRTDVDDARNTDNAWVEATVTTFFLPRAMARGVTPFNQIDELEGWEWVRASPHDPDYKWVKYTHRGWMANAVLESCSALYEEREIDPEFPEMEILPE